MVAHLLVSFGIVFAVHSYLVLAVSERDDVGVNLGFLNAVANCSEHCSQASHIRLWDRLCLVVVAVIILISSVFMFALR